MSAVAAAIIVFIIGYTAVNLLYRRPDPPHEPWAEAETRRAAEVRDAGLDWTALRVQVTAAAGAVPAPATLAPVTTEPTPKDLTTALPRELVLVLPGEPALYPSPDTVQVPATLPAAEALHVRLDFPAGGDPPAFGEVLAAAKEHQLWLFLQDARHVAADAAGVPPAPAVQLRLPAAGLAPGSWHARLYTRGTVFAWDFSVTE